MGLGARLLTAREVASARKTEYLWPGVVRVVCGCLKLFIIFCFEIVFCECCVLFLLLLAMPCPLVEFLLLFMWCVDIVFVFINIYDSSLHPVRCLDIKG